MNLLPLLLFLSTFSLTKSSPDYYDTVHLVKLCLAYRSTLDCSTPSVHVKIRHKVLRGSFHGFSLIRFHSVQDVVIPCSVFQTQSEVTVEQCSRKPTWLEECPELLSVTCESWSRSEEEKKTNAKTTRYAIITVSVIFLTPLFVYILYRLYRRFRRHPQVLGHGPGPVLFNGQQVQLPIGPAQPPAQPPVQPPPRPPRPMGRRGPFPIRPPTINPALLRRNHSFNRRNSRPYPNSEDRNPKA